MSMIFLNVPVSVSNETSLLIFLVKKLQVDARTARELVAPRHQLHERCFTDDRPIIIARSDHELFPYEFNGKVRRIIQKPNFFAPKLHVAITDPEVAMKTLSPHAAQQLAKLKAK